MSEAKVLLSQWKEEDGAAAVEYGLLVGLIATVLIVTITNLGSSIYNKFEESACKLSGKTWTAATTYGQKGSCA